MIRQGVSSIVFWLIKNGAIDEEDYELYEYAIYSLFFSWSPLILAVIFGLIMKIPLKAVLMVIPFMVIRKYSGGYHAKNSNVCTCVSLCLMFLFMCILKYTDNGIAIDIMTHLSAGLIVILSPVDSENKRLSESEIKQYKKMTILFSMITLLLYWCMKIQNQTYQLCFSLSLILTAILLIPCLFQKIYHTVFMTKKR